MTCSSFRDEMTREWPGITATRGSAEALSRWSAAETALAGFAGLAEVVDAIAVPIGQAYDASLEIAQAVIRVAAEDILARRLMRQVMAPILSKECFRSSQLLRAQGVVVNDSEIVTLVHGAATDAIAAVAAQPTTGRQLACPGAIFTAIWERLTRVGKLGNRHPPTPMARVKGCIPPSDTAGASRKCPGVPKGTGQRQDSKPVAYH